MLGMLVFVLVWLRLAARLSGPTPGIQPEPPGWQQLSANLLHLALYLLMIVMPLTGWLLLSASGKPIPFFGLELPALVGENKGLAEQLKEIHETIGTAGYYLIGLHAAAALYHHYVVRDNTLTRMLPERK
jgi:cytochrome b561